MSDDGLDWARLPFEIKRAADQAGVLLELLDPPGLAAERYDVDVTATQVDTAWLLVTHPASGIEVCRVPFYRLADWDPELMRRVAAFRLAQLAAAGDTARADRYAAAINHRGSDLVTAPPDQDYVYLDIVGEKALAVHRRLVVATWPADVE